MAPTGKTIHTHECQSGHLAPQVNLKLLSHRDVGDGETMYRILADDKHIKYVTIDDDNINSIDEVVFLLSNIWRSGDWDKAVVRNRDCCGMANIFSVTWTEHSDRVWDNGFHRRIIDFGDLTVVCSLDSNSQVISCPQFPGQPLLFKYAGSPEQTDEMKHEMKVYGWLANATGSLVNEVPNFLAHVRMNDEIIGFLIEHVTCRGPNLDNQKDVDACHRAVQHLHRHGILHKNINHDTLQIRSDFEGKALKWGPGREHKAIFLSFDKASKKDTTPNDEANELAHVNNFLAKMLDEDVEDAEDATQYGDDSEDAVIVSSGW